MRILLIISFLCICFPSALLAQEENNWEKVDLVIILSSKNYNDAVTRAGEAAEKMKIELNLRGLKENATIGLSMDSASCNENGWEFPAYVARGRYDRGKYISVEYSDAYPGLTTGYYIVVVCCDHTGEKSLSESLTEAKKFYPDAYVRKTKVYMGCMH